MSTQETPAASSALLLAANERLHALRRALGTTGAWPEAEARAAASPGPMGVGPVGSGLRPTPTTGYRLPAHLGWENERLSEHLRRHSKDQPPPESALPAVDRPDWVEGAASPQRQSTTAAGQTVRHYPDLGLAMLRTGQAAAGRVWLLLRHVDINGQGWIGVEQAARLLASDAAPQGSPQADEAKTAATPPLRICGRRQFRKLLAAGEGLFWERAATRDGEERLWLRGPARVAAALGLRRLSAAPVALPLTALLGGIGDVRAHFYAAFHSGRGSGRTTDDRLRTTIARGKVVPRPSSAVQTSRRSPISRQSLAGLTAASANSQRAYERRAAVVVRGNVALGPLSTAVDPQAWAWERGRSLFTVIDHDGRHGRPGAAYLAWRLPNDYTGPHARLSRGRLKRINRRIAGLLTNGMTGNVNPASDARGRDGKRYYEDGKSAAGARRAGERYWRAGDAGTWHWWPEEDDGRQTTDHEWKQAGQLPLEGVASSRVACRSASAGTNLHA